MTLHLDKRWYDTMDELMPVSPSPLTRDERERERERLRRYRRRIGWLMGEERNDDLAR
jgi:hypothetical protein